MGDDVDLDVFDLLVDDTGEGAEPGQPVPDQSPTWAPAESELGPR